MRKPHTRVTIKICWMCIIRAFLIEFMCIFSVGKLFCSVVPVMMLLTSVSEKQRTNNNIIIIVICWCWSTVFSEVHSQHSHLAGNVRALHASFCWQALWRCWFHFPAGLGTCPHCQRYQKLFQWPWCYCAWFASILAWPEPHRKSMGYCQE